MPQLQSNIRVGYPASENAINNYYTFVREKNATLDAIITYLRTTNTSVAQNTNQPGAEPLEPIQMIRWKGQLKKSIAQQETMNAFKNIHIMAPAKYLIGGTRLAPTEKKWAPNKCRRG